MLDNENIRCLVCAFFPRFFLLRPSNVIVVDLVVFSIYSVVSFTILASLTSYFTKCYDQTSDGPAKQQMIRLNNISCLHSHDVVGRDREREGGRGRTGVRYWVLCVRQSFVSNKSFAIRQLWKVSFWKFVLHHDTMMVTWPNEWGKRCVSGEGSNGWWGWEWRS